MTIFNNDTVNQKMGLLRQPYDGSVINKHWRNVARGYLKLYIDQVLQKYVDVGNTIVTMDTILLLIESSKETENK